MPEHTDLVLRPMTRAEVDLAIEWAAQEGWNPGLRDAENFYAADPNGFFVAELSGRPAGCISAVAYDATFGFLGLYIVKPELRGQGVGLQLWQQAMDYLGTRNIGLDGVVAQQANYHRSGFQLAYRNMRYGGVVRAIPRDRCVDLTQRPFAEIYAYDNEIFPAPREAFLRSWLRPETGVALGMEDGGKLVAYGVLRACRAGYKIGPLFADHEAYADNVLLALAQHAQGATIFLDAPEVNPGAIALAEHHGLSRVFETARMYTKGAPALPLHRVFGVTTFELG